jgi:hypothetical protein
MTGGDLLFPFTTEHTYKLNYDLLSALLTTRFFNASAASGTALTEAFAFGPRWEAVGGWTIIYRGAHLNTVRQHRRTHGVRHGWLSSTRVDLDMDGASRLTAGSDGKPAQPQRHEPASKVCTYVRDLHGTDLSLVTLPAFDDDAEARGPTVGI